MDSQYRHQVPNQILHTTKLNQFKVHKFNKYHYNNSWSRRIICMIYHLICMENMKLASVNRIKAIKDLFLVIQQKLFFRNLVCHFPLSWTYGSWLMRVGRDIWVKMNLLLLYIWLHFVVRTFHYLNFFQIV